MSDTVLGALQILILHLSIVVAANITKIKKESIFSPSFFSECDIPSIMKVFINTFMYLITVMIKLGECSLFSACILREKERGKLSGVSSHKDADSIGSWPHLYDLL